MNRLYNEKKHKYMYIANNAILDFFLSKAATSFISKKKLSAYEYKKRNM